jgi:hypothetical protein
MMQEDVDDARAAMQVGADGLGKEMVRFQADVDILTLIFDSH